MVVIVWEQVCRGTAFPFVSRHSDPVRLEEKQGQRVHRWTAQTGNGVELSR